MTADAGQLTPLDDGVWVDTQPVSIVGTELTATMTVLRLGGGELLLYSPIRMTPERRAAVEALGRVAHLYAPNLFHHSYVGEWSAAFPSARVHAATGLTKKRPELRVDRVHTDGAEPAFAGLIDELHVDGFRLRENVLVYRPARTLLVADLVHNVGRPQGAWTKLYTQTMGFYDRIALSRMLRWTAFSDRAAARRSIDQLLELSFDRVIVGHGLPIAAGAKDALRDAFTWLSPTPGPFNALY